MIYRFFFVSLEKEIVCTRYLITLLLFPFRREPQRCFCGTSECRGWLGEPPDQKTKEEKEEDRRKELKDRLRREGRRFFLEDMDVCTILFVCLLAIHFIPLPRGRRATSPKRKETGRKEKRDRVEG